MKKEFKNYLRIYAINSLFLLLIGIFLLPNYANSTSITEENIIRLANYERIKKGLDPLITNELLTRAAQKKAKDIFKNSHFGHTIADRAFSSWIKDEKYEYTYVGENLAMDFISSEGTINAWLDSPTHKQNLLNERFKETGVAVLDGKFESKNTILIVQIFGAPEASAKITAKTEPVSKNFIKSPAMVLNVNFDENKKILSMDNNVKQDQDIYLSEKYLTLLSPADMDRKNKLSGFISGKSQENYFLIVAILISISTLIGLTFFRSLTTGLYALTLKKHI